MNAPDRFELFTLQPHEKKVESQKDTKIENAALFIIRKEDHTVGNVLRMQLLNDKDVLFVGYRMPHPLLHEVHMKIQTAASTTPARALENAISDLINECALLEEKFKQELHRRRAPEAESYY